MPTIAQLKKGQSDPALKEAGVWFTILVPDDTEPLQLKLKLRSIASNTVRAWEIKRFREQRNYYLNDNVPPVEVLDQNEADKLAEAMVVDWNITNEDGTPAGLAVDTIRATMLQLPDARRDALAEASKHANYRKLEVVAIEKNSALPSSQGSATVAEEA